MLLSSPMNPEGIPRHSEALHYRSCARRSDTPTRAGGRATIGMRRTREQFAAFGLTDPNSVRKLIRRADRAFLGSRSLRVETEHIRQRLPKGGRLTARSPSKPALTLRSQVELEHALAEVDCEIKNRPLGRAAFRRIIEESLGGERSGILRLDAIFTARSVVMQSFSVRTLQSFRRKYSERQDGY
jgi:hypothetical protein